MREYLGGDSGEYHVVVAEAPDECQHAMEPSNLLCVVLCVGRVVVRLVGLNGGPWVMRQHDCDSVWGCRHADGCHIACHVSWRGCGRCHSRSHGAARRVATGTITF